MSISAYYSHAHLLRSSTVSLNHTQETPLINYSFSNSTDEFKEKVTNSQEPILVDFFATWCGPCKAISPQIEKLSNEHTGIKFYQIDVDQLSEVAAENGISAMPTFLFFKGGEKVETVRGANPPAIMAGVQKLLE